jgi:hypothetical protein
MKVNPVKLGDAHAAQKSGGAAAIANSVKVTLHLTIETAQRLGIESAMRRVPQSAIAEEVLAAYLSRWRLPSAEAPVTQNEC